jgi:hypothetical protein
VGLCRQGLVVSDATPGLRGVSVALTSLVFFRTFFAERLSSIEVWCFDFAEVRHAPNRSPNLAGLPPVCQLDWMTEHDIVSSSYVPCWPGLTSHRFSPGLLHPIQPLCAFMTAAMPDCVDPTTRPAPINICNVTMSCGRHGSHIQLTRAERLVS